MLAVPRTPLHSDSESSTTASSSLPSRMTPNVSYTPSRLVSGKSSSSRQQLPQNGKDSTLVSLKPADDVQPIICTSEKELAREFDVIHKTLSDVRGDWNNRCNALKRTQGLVLGSAHIDRFLPLCLRLREPILTQVQDLRSAIVREACAVLLVLVLALGADLESFAVPAIPVLLRITSIAIQIVAESGFQCICAIVRECRTQRVLQTLLDQFSTKNGAQRWRSTQALLLALQTHPSAIVERHIESVESVIKHCLEDTREDVRACGKKCFWAFKSLFEERGCRFLARLDPTRQRALQADRAQSLDPHGEDAEAAEARADKSPVPRRLNPERLRSDSRNNLEPSRGPPGSPERAQIIVRQGDSRRNSFGSTCTPGASVSLAAAPSPGASFTLAAAPDSPGASVTSTQGSQVKTVVKKHSTFRPSPRVLTRITPPHGGRSPSPKSSPNSTPAVPQRLRGQAKSPAPRSPSARARESQGAGQVSCCSIPSLCKMARTSEAMEQRWTALADLAERLRQRSSEEGCSEDLFPEPLVEDVVGASLHGLRDAPQVAMAALAVLGALLPGQPRLCSRFLDRLLLGLLSLECSGTAAELSQRFCLGMLVEHQPPEVLIETLGSLLAGDWCIENIRDDIIVGCAEVGKLAALDFLETRVATSTEVCNYLAGRVTGGPAGIVKREGAGPMKVLLQDLLRCCRAWPPDSQIIGQEQDQKLVRQATARALAALQAAETSAFKTATAELHPGPKDSLLAIMQESLTVVAHTGTTDDGGTCAVQQPSLGAGTPARPEVLEDAAPPPATPQVPPQPRPQSQQNETLSLASILKHGCPSTLRATFRNLAMAARTQDQNSWDSHFGRVLVLVLDHLCHQPADQERQGIREAALLCLQEIIVHHPRRFNDFAEIVASKLFESYRSCGQGDRQIAQAVERALERLMNILEPLRAVEILMPVVASDGAPLLQAATRLLSGVLQRMLPTEVMQHLGILLPGIVVAFGSQIPEHRKAAVFCLVDMYMLVGEQLMPYLAKDLTPSQLKLVTIYIGRQQKEQQELASAPVGHTGQEVSRTSLSKSSRYLLGK